MGNRRAARVASTNTMSCEQSDKMTLIAPRIHNQSYRRMFCERIWNGYAELEFRLGLDDRAGRDRSHGSDIPRTQVKFLPQRRAACQRLPAPLGSGGFPNGRA